MFAKMILLLLALASHVQAESLSRVYLDRAQNVHVVQSNGREQQLTKSGLNYNATLAPDGKTAAWLVAHTWNAPGDTEPSSSELVLYRHGKSHRIHCEPFIRDYWFWNRGDSIAIDCGGRHFAGREILYDSVTLKIIDSFDQGKVPAEKRPEWSASKESADSN